MVVTSFPSPTTWHTSAIATRTADSEIPKQENPRIKSGGSLLVTGKLASVDVGSSLFEGAEVDANTGSHRR